MLKTEWVILVKLLQKKMWTCNIDFFLHFQKLNIFNSFRSIRFTKQFHSLLYIFLTRNFSSVRRNFVPFESDWMNRREREREMGCWVHIKVKRVTLNFFVLMFDIRSGERRKSKGMKESPSSSWRQVECYVRRRNSNWNCYMIDFLTFPHLQSNQGSKNFVNIWSRVQKFRFKL